MSLVDLWGIADLHCGKVESTKWLKNIYKKILLAKGSVLVIGTKFNVQIGAGRHVSRPC